MKKVLLIVFGLFVSFYLEGQVVYTLGDTGYYTQFIDGGGIFSNADGSELGMWANPGNKKIVAWRQFQTNGTNSGSARSLQVGDVFTVQVNATSAYGSIGFSINSSPSTSTWADRHSNSRLYIQVEGTGNSWYVNSAAGNQTLSYNVGTTRKDYKFIIHITSYTTCDIEMYVNGAYHTRLFNVTMNGTAGANLSHFALYMNNDWNGNSNADIYWKQTTTHNAIGVSNLGYYLTSGNYTPGLITDGFESTSNSSNSINAINIGGASGTSVTLNQNNIYTGLTTINTNATAIANHANAFGTTDGSIIVSNGGRIQLSGGVSVGTEGLTLNGVGISQSGSLQNISGDNSWAGNIISNTSRINSDSGLLTIIGNVDSGSLNTYIGGNGNVKMTGLFTGTLNSGDGAIFKDGNGILTLTNDNVNLTGIIKNTSGTINIGDGGTTGAVAGDIVNNATLVFHRSNDYAYAGSISGTGTLTKKGAGKLTLSGTNTYSGNTTVEAGTLEITGSISSTTSTVTVKNGATLIINGTTAKMYDLVIETGGIVQVKGGHVLEVVNSISNEGTIEVENTASVIQTNDVVNTGNGIYEVNKTTNPYIEYDYIYWSSPLSNQTFASVFAANEQNYIYENLAQNYADINSGAYVGGVQTTAGSDGYDDNGNDWDQPSTSTMTAGRGYIVLGAGSDIPFVPNSSSTFETFASGQSVVFNEGKFNNGTIGITLLADANNTDPSINQNLIGNPYPSVLDLMAFYNDIVDNNSDGQTNNSILNSTFYFWTHHTDVGVVSTGPDAYNYNSLDFSTYNASSNTSSNSSSGGSGPGRYMPSGQAFIAEASNPSYPVYFKNSMRSQAVTNFSVNKMNSNTEKDVVKLKLTRGTDIYRQTVIVFIDGAIDAQIENYDSRRMIVNNETDLYSMVTGDPTRLVIQGLSSFENTKTIPLGLQIKESDTFEISIDEIEGIFSQTQKIYLEDTYQDIIHNLSDGAYSFTQTAGTDINDRFILRFTNTQLGHEEAVLEDLKLYPNPTKGLLNIAYTGSEPLQITLYNQVGHTVGTYEGVQVLDLSQLAQGMYFAKIANSQGSVTRKIVVE